MAEVKETGILVFEVDQGAALVSLEQTNKAIIATKESQAELNKAYKAGSITLDEYAEESTRLQAVQKKEIDQKKLLVKAVETESNSINALRQRTEALKKERNNLDLTTQKGLDRLDQLNKKINQNDKALEKNISLIEKQKFNFGQFSGLIDQAIPGLSGLTSNLGLAKDAFGKAGLSMAAFGSVPIVALLTSAITVIESLSAAFKETGYEAEIANRITIQFFEEQVKQLDAVNRALQLRARLLGVSGADEGTQQGAERDIIQNQRRQAVTELLALELKLSDLRLKADQDILENGELINKNIETALLIGLKDNERINAYIEKQREELEGYKEAKQAVIDKDEEVKQLTDDLTVQLAVVQKISEEDRKIADINRRLARANRSGSFTERQGIVGTDETREVAVLNGASTSAQDSFAVQSSEAVNNHLLGIQVDFNKRMLRTKEKGAKDQRDLAKSTAEYNIELQMMELQATAQLAGALSALFGENKALASAEALINTYLAIDKTLRAFAGVPIPGYAIIQAVATGAFGLAQVAQINNVGFAEGGYTGKGGKHDVAGIVHRDEYVVPKWQVHNPIYSGHIAALESGRTKGFADGGLASAPALTQINQQLMMTNALKNMPNPEVSVKEITRTQRKVNVKQNISRLGAR